MKKYFCFLLIVSFCGRQSAAQPVPDSIRQLYKAATTLRDKRVALTRYVNSIRTTDAFFPQATAIIDYLRAEKQDDVADFVQLQMNDQLAKTGDYISSLTSSLEIAGRFQKMNDRQGLLMAYRTLSTTYYYAGDVGKDAEYSSKAAAIAIELNYNGALATIYNNLSTSYAQRKMADSAIFYAKLAVSTVNKARDTNQIAAVLGTLGEAYILQKKYDEALNYIRQSINSTSEYEALGEVWNLNDLAQIFLETNRFDSAKFYAYQAASLSTENRFKDQQQRAYGYLSRSFAATGAADSAYRYLQYALDIKDSLYTSEKSKQVNGITGREQARLQAIEKERADMNTKIRLYSLLAGLIVLCIIAGIFYRNNRQKQKANKVLEDTLRNLKATQTQLIQSEKMASLGELTAGIAHEIQNPLNFVNNFSEINNELIDEVKSHPAISGTVVQSEELHELLNDIFQNNEKINHHGKRADAIVKGMLQHSQSSTGKKEPADINKLADEYLRLSYHGLRAKDKSFNATLKVDFDESIGNINIIPQDVGRVLLNLFNNAFYAVKETTDNRQPTTDSSYQPTVSLSTRKVGDTLEIKVSDNGNGIPSNIADKIFQPFFTTKPTGQGTGLGLSLSYDIITKGHGGELKAESKAGEGSTFVMLLPLH